MRGMWWVVVAVASCTSTPAEVICGASCDRAARCVGWTPDGCAEDCAARAPWAEQVSPEEAEAFESCADELSCASEAAMAETCVKDRIEISEQARAFCGKLAVSAFDCGWFISLDECEHGYSPWSEKSLDSAATRCLHTECGKLFDCIHGAVREP